MSSVNNPTLISVETLKNWRKIRGFEKAFVHEDSVCVNLNALILLYSKFLPHRTGFFTLAYRHQIDES